MSVSIVGYVLEPPRVGGSNNAFTYTPNDTIADQASFDAAYPQGSEPNPRTEYLILVQTDGLLVDATFGWTKNEVVQRFDYFGQNQQFWPLGGAPLEQAGTVTADANTTRLKVTVPLATLAEAPFRLSVGVGVGTTLSAVLVTSFGSPSAGTVEVLSTTGELNWNAADLSTYNGLAVRWQRQQFYTSQESKGLLGLIQDTLLLNPLPATGQFPLIRVGYGLWLTPVEKANDGSLDPSGSIPQGTVQWSKTTGLLRFSSVDLATFQDRPIYYDGVLFSFGQTLPRQSVGTVTVPTTLLGLPSAGGDLVFRLTGSGYQFPTVRRLDAAASFDAGSAGEVQVKPSGLNGLVQFSQDDQDTYGAASVEVVFGDMPIERGVVLRLFRTTVNLTGEGTTPDVKAFYTVEQSTFADPIAATPFVFLPAVPVEDTLYPLTVQVKQGTGSFTGTLPQLDVPSPPAGLGYLLDRDQRQLLYAQRKANQILTVTQPQGQGAVTLPDPGVFATGLDVEVETGPGTGVYVPQAVDVDYLLDTGSGTITFLVTQGQIATTGTSTSFTNWTLTDPSATFLSTVQPGYYVQVLAGPAAGLYRVDSVLSDTQLLTDVQTPVATTDFLYQVMESLEIVADRYWVESPPKDPATILTRLTPLGAISNEMSISAYGTINYSDQYTALGTGDFAGDGVMPGDTLMITSGPDNNSYRTITGVDATTLIVASTQPFTSFSASSAAVVRRLRLTANQQQVRLGTDGPTITPTPVSDDALFTSPGLLPAGSVEVSQATGNLNFSAADVTTYTAEQVYATRVLELTTDYRITPALGFIELTERLLAYEEVLITYRSVDPVTNLPTAPITERAAFLVPKEVTQPYPRPAVVNTVFFNPTGRTIAQTPAPKVYRGGRPQAASKINLNTVVGSIQFLPAVGFQTNALPSGDQLQTNERVYVDYYVHQAFGGEATFSIQQPPMAVAQVTLTGGKNTLTIRGDQTLVYPVGHLLRVEKANVFLIAGSTYDGGQDMTTITLATGEVFADNATNPTLYVSSGPAPYGGPFGYFTVVTTGWRHRPRGGTTITLAGNHLQSYRDGTVVLFLTVLSGSLDFYLVTGVKLLDSGDTLVTVASPFVREYEYGSVILAVSKRPVGEDGQTAFQLSGAPLVDRGYQVYRRTQDQVGVAVDTKLDASGAFTAAPLQPNEAILVAYTRYNLLAQGRHVKVSYTNAIVPSSSNGLLGQRLIADFTLFRSDTFFYRVETLTNFRAEVTQDLEAEAKGNAPTAGPITSNQAQTPLYKQGRESLYFQEGHLANVDFVMRALLKFANDLVHRLNDVQQDVDGRVVGEADGRFRFDGEIDNPPRTTLADVTNQIDDVFQISPFPITVVWNPPAAPVVTYVGTNLPLWQASVYSRFFPGRKDRLKGLTVAGDDTGATTGNPILDYAQTQMTAVPPVTYRRWPRSWIKKDAYTGDTELFVDNAQGTADLLRPGWGAGMTAIVTDRDGTPLITDTGPLTITAVLGAPERLQVSALPVDLPKGATIYLCVTGASKDTSYQKSYRIGTDVNVVTDQGLLVFVEPYFPFDGSVPLIPAELEIQPPNSNEILQMDGTTISYTSTTPNRFPAMDGLPYTDSNDQGLPIQSPTPEQEVMALEDEQVALTAAAASQTPVTQASVSLDVTGTVLTNAVAFTAPLPQVYDLVRFTTGPNASAGYRRILSLNLGFNQVTVDTPFTTPSSSGAAIVTASADVSTGAATFPSTTILDDPTLSASIIAGQTVVITSGLNVGVRRQVVRRISATQLLLDYAVPFLAAGNYRVSYHLNTFSDFAEEAVQTYKRVIDTNDHDLDPTKQDSQINAIERFYDGDTFDNTQGVLTDRLSPASSTGSVSATVLTDGGQDFLTQGVAAGDYVYIRTGSNRGFYPVASVTTTTLTVTVSFPLAGVVSYRVVSAYGLGFAGLKDLFAILSNADDTLTLVTAWLSTIQQTEAVYVPGPLLDLTIYANTLTMSQVTTRQGQLTTRTAYMNTILSKLNKVLATRDKLYEVRWSWVTGRLDVQKGMLYKIRVAQQQRLDAAARLTSQLLQLLALEALP